MDSARIKSDSSSLWESVPCGKRYGIHDHAQVGDLYHMLGLCLFDYRERHLTGIFGQS